MKYSNLISMVEIPVIILILCLPVLGIFNNITYTTMLIHGLLILSSFYYALSKEDERWLTWSVWAWIGVWFVTLIGMLTMMFVMDYDKVVKDTQIHDVSMYVDEDSRVVTKANTIIDIPTKFYLLSKANKCIQIEEKIFEKELKVFKFHTTTPDFYGYKCTKYKTKSQLPEVEF